MLNQNVDFDAYMATIDCSELDLISFIQAQIDLSEVRKIRNKLGYHYGAQIHRGEVNYCDVFWGSSNGGTHVRTQGDTSPVIQKLLLEYTQTHNLPLAPSRIDAKVDWVDEGLFDTLSKLATDFAMEKDLSINTVGDWVRGKGRTLYIGSRKSQLMVRIYEKGHQLGADPNWVRFETEVKPNKHDAKAVAASRTASEILYTGWAGEFLETLGFIGSKSNKLPSAYRPSDEERARRTLIRQYGRIILSWRDDTGSWDELGKQIEAEYHNLKEPEYAD